MKVKTASGDRYKLLKMFAKENRDNQTEAESVLWQYLRCNALGHKFYRQYIIGDFIVDFLCHDDGLIIEVDGGYHSEPRQETNDEERTRMLESMGYHVLRFTNEEILFDTNTVIYDILTFLS